MLGLPLLDRSGDPATDRCDKVLEDLKNAGVLAGKTGSGRNVLTFLPPLVIDELQIGELIHVLDEVLLHD